MVLVGSQKTLPIAVTVLGQLAAVLPGPMGIAVIPLCRVAPEPDPHGLPAGVLVAQAGCQRGFKSQDSLA